jgi:hypothetical protein
MFGYVRADTMELKVKEYELYRATYCGICRAMKRCCSCTSCMALSYDSVFLALLRLTLSNEKTSLKMRRCIVHPLKKRAMMEECESLDYTARVGGVLAYDKVMDNWYDSRGLRKLAAGLARPFASRWVKKAALPSDLRDEMTEALAMQHRLEKEQCASADEAAIPFGNLLSAVCAYGVEDAQKALLAKEIGFHLGKTIYLLDACDDYQKDKKHNRYNPFVLANEDPYQNELIRTSIRMECRAAYQALQLLDVTDDGVFAILENLLARGIPKETDRVLALIDSKKEKDRIERKAEP